MEEELLVRQRQEKLRLPKIQRTEGKTRMNMYKKSLKIQGLPASNEREKVKQVFSFSRIFTVWLLIVPVALVSESLED